VSIRVLLADDQTLVRSGFRMLLERTDDIEVAGEASTGTEAVERVRADRPDVVLMDIRMPVIDRLEATRRIASDRKLADVRVIMLTTFDLDEYVFEALHAGASGFLLKDVEPDDLRDAVRVVAGSDALLSPSVTRRLISVFVSKPRRERARGTEPGRRRPQQRRARRAAGHQPRHGDDPHEPHPAQARGARRAQLVVIALESGLVKARRAAG
jgi:DNA-binding NarL/FixJ family response regulator